MCKNEIFNFLIKNGYVEEYFGELYRVLNMEDTLYYLTELGYNLHHMATAKGYISRLYVGEIEPYHGKFGDGFKVHKPRKDTTNYHYISYYVRKCD